MNNSEKSKSEDEINLISVLKAIDTGIVAFFSRIFKFILRILSSISSVAISLAILIRKLIFAIARHYVLFTIMIVLGGAGGFGTYKIIRPYYTGTMIIASEGLKGLYFLKTVADINGIAKEANYIELARKLKVDTLVSKNIKEINIELSQFFNTQDELNAEIEVLEKEKKMLGEVPEDLVFLFRRYATVRKHIEANKHDETAARGLHLTESKINRLIKYYKRVGRIPEKWKFDPDKSGFFAG